MSLLNRKKRLIIRNKKTGRVEVWHLRAAQGKFYTSIKQFLEDYEDVPKIGDWRKK